MSCIQSLDPATICDSLIMSFPGRWLRALSAATFPGDRWFKYMREL